MKRKILTDADKAWLEQGYYATTREKLGVSGAADVTTKYIRDLYKALPGCEEREVKSDDGSFTNYEYVFTTRDYTTTRKRDDLHVDDVKKPKYPILSGIHGKEKNAIISTYRFVRDVLNGHNVPSRFREGVELHVLPTGTPDAIDATSRISANKVNINRNFDWEWVKETIDATTGEKTGDYAVSEKETQAIVNWLKANTDAELFLDMHNSNSLYEAAMLIGLENNAAVDRAKRIALQGIDRIIPYWRDVMGYGGVVQDMEGHKEFDGVTDTVRSKVFSYAATVDDTGLCCQYAAGVLGIPSLVLEISVLQKGDYYTDYLGAVDTDNNGRYDTATYPNIFDPETVASGAEAIGNVLLEFFAECEQGGGGVYYTSLSGAVNDVNAGEIGANANASKDTAVARVYTGYNGGTPYVELMRDASELDRVTVSVPMTINLNGHLLSVSHDAVAIGIDAEDVIIDGTKNGSGVSLITAMAMARTIQVSLAKKCTVKGGRYAAASTHATGTAMPVFVNGGGAYAVLSGCVLSAGGATTIGLDLLGNAGVRNCVIKNTSTGVLIEKQSDISVTMDNCDLSKLGSNTVAFSMPATKAETSNALYVSNTTIPGTATISIGSDTHRLYIGAGNNFTADDTDRPAAVETTDAVYTPSAAS